MNEPEPDWSRLPEDPLGFFELQPGFDPRELRRRYARLIRVYRPESQPDEFQQIRRAYEALREPDPNPEAAPEPWGPMTAEPIRPRPDPRCPDLLALRRKILVGDGEEFEESVRALESDVLTMSPWVDEDLHFYRALHAVSRMKRRFLGKNPIRASVYHLIQRFCVAPEDVARPTAVRTLQAFLDDPLRLLSAFPADLGERQALPGRTRRSMDPSRCLRESVDGIALRLLGTPDECLPDAGATADCVSSLLGVVPGRRRRIVRSAVGLSVCGALLCAVLLGAIQTVWTLVPLLLLVPHLLEFRELDAAHREARHREEVGRIYRSVVRKWLATSIVEGNVRLDELPARLAGHRAPGTSELAEWIQADDALALLGVAARFRDRLHAE